MSRRQEQSYLEPNQRMPIAKGIGWIIFAIIGIRTLIWMIKVAAR